MEVDYFLSKKTDSFEELENLAPGTPLEERSLQLTKEDLSGLLLIEELGKDLFLNSRYLSRLELVAELRNHGVEAEEPLFTLKDLRKVDPAFHPSECLTVIGSVLLVRLGQISAIILPQKIILLDPESTLIKRVMSNILQLLQNEREHIPFPFSALEGLVLTACLSLEREVAVFEPLVLEALQQVTKYSSYNRLAVLQVSRQKLVDLKVLAENMDEVLEAFFDSDFVEETLFGSESKSFVKRQDEIATLDDLECVFEPYLQSLDLSKSLCSNFLKAIEDTERALMLSFDFVQNKLFTLDLLGTIVGFFGLNLDLPIYNAANGSEYYFYGIVGGLTLVTFVSIVGSLWWMRKKRFLLFHENIG
eukprot:jgi/Galph1/3252/GphlegSOOS_G1890.1